MRIPISPLAALSVIAFASSCDSVEEALEAGPQTSYCTALCDWAVACAEDERAIEDADAVYADCLEATYAADSSCAEADEGTLDVASATALTACTDALEDASSEGECGGHTGSIDDIKAGTTVPECAAQGADAQAVYDASRDSTAESSDELCDRYTLTFCESLDECVVGEVYSGDIPQEVVDELGGTPVDLCVAGLSAITDQCKSDSLYEPEAEIDDLNTARQGARECLNGIVELTCDELFSGEVPKLCAAAFSSAEDAQAFFLVLADLAASFADAAG